MSSARAPYFSTNYTNDAADQLTSVGSTSYTYDQNGNLATRGSDTFTFSYANQLTQTVIGGATATSTYNGDGLRMSHTVGAATANYVWDVNRSVPETLQNGTNTYVCGLGRISSTDGSGVQTYYDSDGLGSTADLTNSSATRTDGYSYDVFGAATHSPGSSTQPFLFTGQQTDADSGLQYLRARYYDPSVGRFLSHDPLGVGNPYSYADNNPATLVDPLGLCGVRSWDDPLDCITGAINTAWDCVRDIFKCTYAQRSPLTSLIETAFFETSGGDVVDKEGGLRIVTTCTGFCADFLRNRNQQGITIGHTIFTLHDWGYLRTVSGQRFLGHEKRHVRQYEILGDYFLPLYLGPANVIGLVACAPSGFDMQCIHDYNLFEILAGPSH